MFRKMKKSNHGYRYKGKRMSREDETRVKILETEYNSATGIDGIMWRIKSSVKKYFKMIVIKPIDCFVTFLFFLELRAYRFFAGRLPDLELLKVQNNLTTDKNNTARSYEEKLQELKSELKCANDDLSMKKERMSQLENEKCAYKKSCDRSERAIATNNERILKLEKQIRTKEENERRLNGEKEELQRRLSEFISVKLRDNNPNIADLNDQCRPTKLAEMYSELYDNEWTDSYSVLVVQLPEQRAIEILFHIIVASYEYCSYRVNESWSCLEDWFFDVEKPSGEQQKVCKWLKDNRKAVVARKVQETVETFTKKLLEEIREESLKTIFEHPDVKKYIKKCVNICLLMRTNDPPVVLVYEESILRLDTANQINADQVVITSSDPNASVESEDGFTGKLNEKQNDTFNKAAYREYTARGKYVDFIVWPPMLLHENGAMLCKGIAQGTNKATRIDALSSPSLQTA